MTGAALAGLALPHSRDLHQSFKTPDSPYRSFWMGGYEGADHINSFGAPLDMVVANGHLARLDEDYADAARLGLRTVRESIGWRLCEPAHGVYELDRVVRLARAARQHGVQIIWSVMHYGTPADVSFFDDAMVERFATFAGEVARVLKPWHDSAPIYNPVNEISFLAWAVAETNLMSPYRNDRGTGDAGRRSGYDVKRRLVRAALAAMRTMRAADPRARFLHVEPLVHVVAPPDRPELQALAAEVSGYQWHAFDLLSGRLEPELGGSEEALDLLGVNHYESGQWDVQHGHRLQWDRGDPRRRGPAQLLRGVWERYGRPVLIAETSHVGEGRAAWLDHMALEVLQARAEGTRISGICLYPLVDRPDWEQPSAWHRSGLFDVVPPAPAPPEQAQEQAEHQAQDDDADRTSDLSANSASNDTLNDTSNNPPHNTPNSTDSTAAFQRHLHPSYAASLARWQFKLPSPMEPCMRTIVVFCHLRWGFVYQRPQHLLTRLAKHYRVVLVEEPVHAEGPAHLVRSSPAAGVEVLCPHTPIHAPGFHDEQLPTIRTLVQQFMRDDGITAPLVWFYTPMAFPLLNAFTGAQKPSAVVYDCMDELSAFVAAPRELLAREHALMETADVVLTGGPSLYEARKDTHPNVHCLPSAVDAAHYAPQRLLPHSKEAHDARHAHANIGHPRLGFFGVIDERMDLDLVVALADARPQWQWVMAGPVVKIDPAKLPQRANLHWLGMQPYAVLPYLAAEWDVCLMPFALNESTRFISPTKTLEYMAAGKPVVSTAVRDVRMLYSDVVDIADDAAQFIAFCEKALAETGAQRTVRQSAMREMVQRLSWDSTVARIERQLKAATDMADAKADGEAEAIIATTSKPMARPGALSPLSGSDATAGRAGAMSAFPSA